MDSCNTCTTWTEMEKCIECNRIALKMEKDVLRKAEAHLEEMKRVVFTSEIARMANGNAIVAAEKSVKEAKMLVAYRRQRIEAAEVSYGVAWLKALFDGRKGSRVLMGHPKN